MDSKHGITKNSLATKFGKKAKKYGKILLCALHMVFGINTPYTVAKPFRNWYKQTCYY